MAHELFRLELICSYQQDWDIMFSDRDYYRRPAPGSGFGSRGGGESMIKPLIIANVAVFLLQIMTGGEDMRHGLTPLVALDFGSIKQLQLWRFGTYMFAHGSFFHILINMWGLYIFGAPLEQQIGPNRFLKLYFVSGLIGGLIWLIFNTTPITLPTGAEHYPRVIGASGSVFGIMMAAAMLAPDRRYMLLFPPIPIKLKTLVTVFAALEIFHTLQRGGGQVAHLGHLGGLIGGYFFVIHWVPGWRKFKIRRFVLEKIQHWRLRNRWRNFRTAGENVGRSSNSRRRSREAEEEEDTSDLSIDDILDKIGEQGLSSLTSRERRKLENARNRLKGKH